MSVQRNLLRAFRQIQYKIYARHQNGIMPSGELCTHISFEDDTNHGDVVHPCVRYIPEGFLGHKWWMVYTPYYAANANVENPVLCYADSDPAIAPIEWRVYCLVQEQPEKGYNSDPTLFYDEGNLYVMWRENLTKRCDEAGFVRATFGAKVINGGIGEVFGPLVGTKDFDVDPEVSPTFIKQAGKYRCFSMHLKFHSKHIHCLNGVPKRVVSALALILDILGIWSQQKSYGIAQWSAEKLEGPYTLDRTVKFTNCNKLYRPWHMDLFENKGVLYAIVQTNQCNADICLAKSMDGEHFMMYQKPLITNKSINMVGIYKPTGLVVDRKFYLYYTAQHPHDRKLNILCRTCSGFDDILNCIR